MADEPACNPTVAVLLTHRGGRRDFVPLSRSFLQIRRRGGGAGPLSWFVRARRLRALELYLLAHAIASVEPYDVALPARVWALALGLPDTSSSRVFVSGALTFLEQHRLVRTERDGRVRRIWLLDEAGSGAAYWHGSSSGRKLDYFKLPHAFWLEGWSERLGLPAVAVLLIALSLPRSFALPYERGGEWYGLSRDTIRRGITELRQQELLTMRIAWNATTLSPTGATEERRYTLAGSFASKARRARRIATDPS